MNATLTAPHVSFEKKPRQDGGEEYELIVSPDLESLADDIANGVKATRLIDGMRALGFSFHLRRRSDGGLVVNFLKT